MLTAAQVGRLLGISARAVYASALRDQRCTIAIAMRKTFAQA